MTLNVAEIEARWADIVEPENVDAPWTAQPNPKVPGGGLHEILDAHNDIHGEIYLREVAIALAAARTDIPALIERVRQLEVRKVFVVTQGDYSDYHILAVFSTREKAEEYAQAREAEIEEFELDAMPTTGELGLAWYYVSMDRDGDTHWVACLKDNQFNNAPRTELGVNRMSVHVAAKSKEHAVKIANERRVQLIASGEWTP